mgnify:CR=1 FL=1
MKKALALMLGLILTSPVMAEFYDHRHYTTDSVTGLDWLDIRETLGRSYFQIQKGDGGFLENGWRIANIAELAEMFGRVTDLPQGAWERGNAFVEAQRLVACLGVGAIPGAYSDNGLPVQDTAHGIAEDQDPTDDRVGFGTIYLRHEDADNNTNPPTPIYQQTRWDVFTNFYRDSQRYPYVGVWMVRPTASLGRGPKC